MAFYSKQSQGRSLARHAAGSMTPSASRNVEASDGTVLVHDRTRMIGLAIFAALLIWLVIAKSLVPYLADNSPKVALRLSPGQPEALLNLADAALNGNSPLFGAGTPDQSSILKNRAGLPPPPADGAAASNNVSKNASGDDRSEKQGAVDDSEKINSAFAAVGRAQAVDLATVQNDVLAAIKVDPLDARGLRLLGQAADAAGDDADAIKMMRAAMQLSLHDNIAVMWLMRKSIEADDYKRAIADADILLRTNLSLGPYVVPVLARYAGTKPAGDLVKDLVDKNPPWRRMFFAFLPRSVADVRTPLDILLSLKSTKTPPTTDELGTYLNYLIDHKYYAFAYYAWLQFLTPEELQHVGLLYNGDFAKPPSGLPFDWDIKQGAGVSVDIEDADKNGDRGLSVDFLYGRVEYQSVNELVVLPAGDYQFKGKYRGELIGPRGLKWRVACANDAKAPIAESPMIGGASSQWKDVAFAFTVPATNCPAQYIRLDLDARMASEQLVTGSMMFANLEILRADNGQDSPDSEADASDSKKPDK